MSKIRVGIIRCDLHAVYYGALMDRHNPFLLRFPVMEREREKVKPERYIKVNPCYDWLTGSGYFYHYTQYNDFDKITVPTVDGFQIVKIWDEHPELCPIFSNIFYNKPEVCKTFEEVSDDVDLVFIAECGGDGSDHVKLATPGLKKRVPTFIDKPFTYEVKDARKLVSLAEEYETPVMSLSILREVPHATRFRNRFVELDGPKFGIIKGGGNTMAGHIHAISLAQHLFGSGVEAVECMGQTPLAYIHLDYGGKPDRPGAGVVLCCASGPMYHCSFHASAYSEWGAIHSPNIGDFEFPWGAARILKMIKKMVQTRKPQAPYDEMIECIAIATAARIAQERGKRVYLKGLC